MQTIQVQVNDFLYKQLVEQNVDIQETVGDYLTDYVEDDGYTAISFEEAQKRVTEAVEDYRSGNMETVAVDKAFWDDIEDGLIQRHQKTI